MKFIHRHASTTTGPVGRTIGLLLLVFAIPRALVAQEQLVSRHAAGTGVSYEGVNFGGNGLRQYNFLALDSVHVSGVSQASVPVSIAWTFSDRWRADLTGLYARTVVRYRSDASAAATQTAKLSGMSDLRLRVTGSLIPDRLALTVGANLPTGQTSLSTEEFSVLRIVAAPALGMGSTPVGGGPSGTVGLVAARHVGVWTLAVGGSYEVRGSYQPVAALVAGAPSADFRPGSVFRASATGDRIVGPHRLTVSVTTDVFTDDVIRPPSVGDNTPVATTSVRLGPVVSGDVQMAFAAPHFRQLLAYSALRWRAPFSRNGEQVSGSSGYYFDGGMRGAVSLGPRRDLVVGADTRLHSGLAIDQGLPTSGVASGSLSMGLELRQSGFTAQPYVRGQRGVLRQRGVAADAPAQSFLGFGLGFVAVARF